MLVEMIPNTKKKLHEIEQSLHELNKGNSAINPTDIFSGLDEISKTIDSLEQIALKEPKAKKDDYRRRLQHLRASHSQLKNSLESYLMKSQNNNFVNLKSKLLSGKNPTDNIHTEYALEMAENGSLSRSSQMVNDYINIGREALTELSSQRERLKGIQTKALDILNFLGFSGQLIKAVEKRDFFDKWIVFIGMALVILIIFVIWWFL